MVVAMEHAMKLQDILRGKGQEVHAIGPDASLEEVVSELVRHNIGSLIVCESMSRGMDIRIIGIVTERDVMRAQAKLRRPLGAMRVADVMSADLVTAEPGDRIEHAMRLMTSHRIRHLPIVACDRLLGVISIGDIVKAHHDQLELENFYMASYIRGESAAVAFPPDGA